MNEGWNQVQLNLADFTRRAYGTNYLETCRITVNANCRLRNIYFSDRLYPDEEKPATFKIVKGPPSVERVRQFKESRQSVQSKLTPTAKPAEEEQKLETVRPPSRVTIQGSQTMITALNEFGEKADDPIEGSAHASKMSLHQNLSKTSQLAEERQEIEAVRAPSKTSVRAAQSFIADTEEKVEEMPIEPEENKKESPSFLEHGTTEPTAEESPVVIEEPLALEEPVVIEEQTETAGRSSNLSVSGQNQASLEAENQTKIEE